MASVVTACRLSARAVRRQLQRNASAGGRQFRTAPASWAAHNFAMPAMSPTMTEGNISSWKVKEGDEFSAGDVLLEVETDKAQMDVEAQDDGVVAKIMMGDGSKGVAVGKRIAVLADPGDDIKTLEIPEEPRDAQAGQPARNDRPSPQEESASKIDRTESSESATEGSPSSKPNADAIAGRAADTVGTTQKSSSTTSAKPQKQTYPLYPSVQHLFYEKGLTKENADKIPASGPQGRLLKGDVLAYLGQVEKNYPAEQSARIQKLGHLDLSSVKPAKKPETPKAAKKADVPPPVPEILDTEVVIPISLTQVVATQKRIKDTIGVLLPISTFIERATKLANDDLPRSKKVAPSSDELFHAVLGLDKIPTTSRGHFTPQITALPPTSGAGLSIAARMARKEPDILDILGGKQSVRKAAAAPVLTVVDEAPSMKAFSVTVPKGDEKRGQVFLEKVKFILEADPGSLVL